MRPCRYWLSDLNAGKTPKNSMANIISSITDQYFGGRQSTKVEKQKKKNYGYGCTLDCLRASYVF